jgi:hypothetical protein
MLPDVMRSAALVLCALLVGGGGYAGEQPHAPAASVPNPPPQQTAQQPQRDTSKPCTVLKDLQAPLDDSSEPLDDLGCPR